MVFSNKTTYFKNKDFRLALGETMGRFEENSLIKKFTNKEKKKLYQIFMRTIGDNAEKNPYLINSWTVTDEDCEMQKIVTVFERSEKAMKYIEENMELKETWNTSPYDCSGRWYLGRVNVIVTSDRIIVKQVKYLDV